MDCSSSPSALAERRHKIWQSVYRQLIHHAKPDSRFHHDFMSFTPDFRDSSYAIDRLVQLPCYTSATTILVTPDNSLEQLRHRALKDGKKVLVGTYRLRRGFILLSPHRISSANLEMASTLDGMERPDIGRHLSLAQMQEEGIHIDLCTVGALVFNTQGVVIWEGHGLFEVQWALLHDIQVLAEKTPVIGVAHDCQVIDETASNMEKFTPEKAAEVQCDFIVTPQQTIQIEDTIKPSQRIQFSTLDPKALENIPPLQELKGIRTMEKIMEDAGFGQEKGEAGGDKELTEDEKLGITMVEKIMKGFKV